VLFECEQEVVLNKGIGIAGQSIPVFGWNTGDAVSENDFHCYKVASFK